MAGALDAARRAVDGSIEGGLFDGLGFVKSLDPFGTLVAGQRILLVGLAAAAAGRVAQSVGIDAAAARSHEPAGFDLAIKASPLGLDADDPLPLDVAHLGADTVVVDILMKRLRTPLLRACHAQRITAPAGHELLARQTPEYRSLFGLPEIAQAVRADPSAVRALLLAPRVFLDPIPKETR